MSIKCCFAAANEKESTAGRTCVSVADWVIDADSDKSGIAIRGFLTGEIISDWTSSSDVFFRLDLTNFEEFALFDVGSTVFTAAERAFIERVVGITQTSTKKNNGRQTKILNR